MEFKAVEDLVAAVEGVLKVDGEGVDVVDENALRGELIDNLAYNAIVASSDEVREESSRLIRGAAERLGIKSRSIHDLYMAMGRGEAGPYTVPAINIRGLTYETAGAVFRSAKKADSGAFIFEIAKSEIGYTEQRPAEYTTVILAAAIKESYNGPVFIQGDHFQVNAKNYASDPRSEVEALKALCKEAIEGGFMNIDIDASTVVDLSRETLTEQQRPNFEITAEVTAYIRSISPPGEIISVGGEIGEVGKKNTTVGEFRAFMDGYKEALGDGMAGISKISIQTGTAHGGVVLPDGSIAEVSVDFDTIEEISKVAVEEYSISGVVQHGASTLPDDAFHIFPERGTSEVHLATGFQNMVYGSSSFPGPLLSEIDAHLLEAHGDERKEGETEEQFIYKTRKKSFGPFKKALCDLPADVRGTIGGELEERFDMLFHDLRVSGTKGEVERFVG